MTTDFKLELYSPKSEQDFEKVWLEMEDILLDYPEPWELLYSIESLKEMVAKGLLQPWIGRERGDEKAISLLILTQVLHFPKRRTLEYLIAVGEGLVENIATVTTVIERTAASFGITLAYLRGRPGFKAILEPLGYTGHLSSFVKELSFDQSSAALH